MRADDEGAEPDEERDRDEPSPSVCIDKTRLERGERVDTARARATRERDGNEPDGGHGREPNDADRGRQSPADRPLERSAVDHPDAVGISVGQRGVAADLVHGHPEAGTAERASLAKRSLRARKCFFDVHFFFTLNASRSVASPCAAAKSSSAFVSSCSRCDMRSMPR
jgi:hypothetical protein